MRRDYGAQRETTWNVHLSNGDEVHNTDQLEDLGILPDKTYAQINTEIEQHITALEKLELEVAKHKGELRVLLDERGAIETKLGVFAFQSARRTPRVTVSGATTSSRERHKTIRAWAADQGMKVPPRGAIPKEIHEAFEKAHPGG